MTVATSVGPTTNHDPNNSACAWNDPETSCNPVIAGLPCTCPPKPAATNQSIEKGIYLTPGNKLVHACKVREDIGAGITRCGYRFLIGSGLWIPDATFGEPAKEGATHEFSMCHKCIEGTYKIGAWRDWKYIVNRTLKMIGLKPPTVAALMIGVIVAGWCSIGVYGEPAPITIRNDGTKLIISRDTKAKFLYSVTVSAYESDGKVSYHVSAKQADKDALPLSPWTIAHVGIFLVDHSIPPDDFKAPQ